MAATTPPFQYTPLPTPDSIRLLILSPSPSPTAPLRGYLLPTTIRARSTDLHTGYIALSYVWGDPTPTNTILLSKPPNDASNPVLPAQEATLGITASLSAALRTLRHATLPAAVWADAVCIDQANIPERNAQVRLMGQIYALADHTVIDLSAEKGGRGEEEAVQRALVCAADGAVGWHDEDGARWLLARRWFTRAWVLQELVLSRDPVVQCGGARARWAEVCKVVLRVSEGGGLMRGMDETRRRFRGGEGMELLELLVARRGSAATDKRDLVYAVLGMLRAEVAVSGGFVDYGLDTGEVYTKTARHVVETGIEARGSTDWPTLGELLAAAEDGGPPDRRPWSLPSWVPNWSIPKGLTPLPLTYFGGISAGANFWLGRKEENPLLDDVRRWCTVVTNPPTLVCLGHKVSMTVEVVGPLFPPPSTLPLELRDRCRAILLGLPTPGSTGSSPAVRHPRSERLRDVLVILYNSLSGPQQQPSQQHRQQSVEPDTKWGTAVNNWCRTADVREMDNGIDENPLADAISDYLDSRHAAFPLQGRRLAILRQANIWSNLLVNLTTSRPVMAVVPPHAHPGDICVALLPSLSLYVVREQPQPIPAWKQAVLQKAEAIKSYEPVGYSALPTWARGCKPSKPTSVGTWARLVGECLPILFRRPSSLSLLSNHIVAIL